jgi:hypothetical protein
MRRVTANPRYALLPRFGAGDVVTHTLSQCNDVSRRQLLLGRSAETRHRPESNSTLRVTAALAAALSEGRAS